MFSFLKNKDELEFYKHQFHKTQYELSKTTSILDNYKQLSERRDSVYYNLKTGAGTFQDSNESTRLKQFTQYSFQTLENLAVMDPVIAKILQIIVESVFKNDFNIDTEDKEYFKKFREIWDDLGLEELMYDGYDAGNTFGHAFLLLDVGDGFNYTQELILEKVKSIKSIRMINRYFFAPDPTERNFKFDPVYYYLVQQPITGGLDLNKDTDLKEFSIQVQKLAQEKIHYSRMLPFWGVKLKPYLFRSNLHFHDTYIRKVEQAAKNYHTVMDNISTLMGKIPMATAKLKGLSNVLTDPEQSKILKESMGFREQIRSTNNVSVMDIEENYELYSPTLAGYSEILERVERNLCLVTHIPHDRLFGEGSSGSTTGRTEKTNFETYIQSEQKIKVKPKIKFFMKLFEQVYGLKIPDNYSITFDHSETLTELEASQVLLNNANSMNILAEQGFNTTLFISEKYPQITRDDNFSEIGLLTDE